MWFAHHGVLAMAEFFSDGVEQEADFRAVLPVAIKWCLTVLAATREGDESFGLTLPDFTLDSPEVFLEAVRACPAFATYRIETSLVSVAVEK